MKTVLTALQNSFTIKDIESKRENLTFLTAEKAQCISVLTQLKVSHGFSHFVLMTAVDWIENGLFQITYILNNPEKRIDIAVRIMISRENAEMESAHHLWKQVKTYQRELCEMFGIDFPGSPGVNDNFILEGWDDIPPYRRDFKTKEYAQETFFPREGRKTNDPAEYMRKKLNPTLPNKAEVRKDKDK